MLIGRIEIELNDPKVSVHLAAELDEAFLNLLWTVRLFYALFQIHWNFNGISNFESLKFILAHAENLEKLEYKSKQWVTLPNTESYEYDINGANEIKTFFF